MSKIIRFEDEDLKRLRLAVENQIKAHSKFAAFDPEIADELVALEELFKRL